MWRLPDKIWAKKSRHWTTENPAPSEDIFDEIIHEKDGARKVIQMPVIDDIRNRAAYIESIRQIARELYLLCKVRRGAHAGDSLQANIPFHNHQRLLNDLSRVFKSSSWFNLASSG